MMLKRFSGSNADNKSSLTHHAQFSGLNDVRFSLKAELDVSGTVRFVPEANLAQLVCYILTLTLVRVNGRVQRESLNHSCIFIE